jgi:hypothetical protein
VRLEDEKIPFSPTLCTALWEWRGAERSFLWSPEDLLNKNVSYTSIIINSTLKMTFIFKTSVAKKYLKIFCKAFLI